MSKKPPGDEAADFTDLLGNRRLILVSNREPYTKKKGRGKKARYERTTGGLVSALDPVMRRSGGLWLAWDPGAKGKKTRSYKVPHEKPRFTLARVPVTQTEVRRYYYGFANRALWPLCHYFIDRCHFDEGEWDHYRKINRRFAEVVSELSGPNDVVWVHDYHFCLLPRLLRERKPDCGPIAFFFHIPFPTQEIFRILPWRRQILKGMLGADLVGFHTTKYAGDFLGCCRRLVGAEVDHSRGLARWQGRDIQVGAFPIGIDVEDFRSLASSEAVQQRVAAIHDSMGVDKLILGADRLDYSKGILARLQAIDLLFSRHPEHRGKTGFLQLAVPSRTRVQEYRELKSEIDETVGRINGRHSTTDWQPIRYLYRSVPRPELTAYYLAADVGLVTPLRDGMNLVCLEYCASRVDDDGVLVLSEFTGAAKLLAPDAVLVNPFAVAETADALHEALTMEADERRRRMRVLRKKVGQADVHHWLVDILSTTLGSSPGTRLRTERRQRRARRR